MAITAQSIIQRVIETLKDTDTVRWTVLELVRYINDGQREIVAFRPDATTVTASVSLVAGSKQSIPAAAFRLVDIVRNTNGSKRFIRSVDKALLDAQVPSWYSQASSTEVIHTMFDVREPKAFYVYPPAAVGASVEMIYAAYPVDVPEPQEGSAVSTVTGNINIPDHFANPLADYVLFRAFSKDAEENAVAGRAQAHFSAFSSALGAEAASSVGVSPKV